MTIPPFLLGRYVLRWRFFGSLAQLVAYRSVAGSSAARTINKRRVKKRGGNLANSFIIAF
ncbi:hypothetical protein GTP08_06745 [Lactococcus lactis]|uniref:Uncharacterized protein n=1 Tax=Lactococcus lactis TaxID=1358 RepID=A0A6M0M7Q0_9LACT|nr:hypothetical protein [Lactococcus lactis]NEX55389.1 hypothetical protein [Lactococcus lactis]